MSGGEISVNIHLPQGVGLESVARAHIQTPQSLEERHHRTPAGVLLPEGTVLTALALPPQTPREILATTATQEDVEETARIRFGTGRAEGRKEGSGREETQKNLLLTVRPWEFFRQTAQEVGWDADTLFSYLQMSEDRAYLAEAVQEPAAEIRKRTPTLLPKLDTLPQEEQEKWTTWLTIFPNIMSDRPEDVDLAFERLNEIPEKEQRMWVSWIAGSKESYLQDKVDQFIKNKFPDQGPMMDVLLTNDYDKLDQGFEQLSRLPEPEQFQIATWLEYRHRYADNFSHQMALYATAKAHSVRKTILKQFATNPDPFGISLIEAYRNDLTEDQQNAAAFWLTYNESEAIQIAYHDVLRGKGILTTGERPAPPTVQKLGIFEIAELTKLTIPPTIFDHPTQTIDLGKRGGKITKSLPSLFEAFIEKTSSVLPGYSATPDVWDGYAVRIERVVDVLRYAQQRFEIADQRIPEILFESLGTVRMDQKPLPHLWDLILHQDVPPSLAGDYLGLMDNNSSLDHPLAVKLLTELPPEHPFRMEQNQRIQALENLCTGSPDDVMGRWDEIVAAQKGIVTILPDGNPGQMVGVDLEFKPEIIGPPVPNGFRVGRDTIYSKSPLELRIKKDAALLAYSNDWRLRMLDATDWLKTIRAQKASLHLHVDAYGENTEPVAFTIEQYVFQLLFGTDEKDFRYDNENKLNGGTMEIRTALERYNKFKRGEQGFQAANITRFVDFLTLIREAPFAFHPYPSATQVHDPLQRRLAGVLCITDDPKTRAAAVALLHSPMGLRLVGRSPEYFPENDTIGAQKLAYRKIDLSEDLWIFGTCLSQPESERFDYIKDLAERLTKPDEVEAISQLVPYVMHEGNREEVSRWAAQFGLSWYRKYEPSDPKALQVLDALATSSKMKLEDYDVIVDEFMSKGNYACLYATLRLMNQGPVTELLNNRLADFMAIPEWRGHMVDTLVIPRIRDLNLPIEEKVDLLHQYIRNNADDVSRKWEAIVAIVDLDLPQNRKDVLIEQIIAMGIELKEKVYLTESLQNYLQLKEKLLQGQPSPLEGEDEEEKPWDDLGRLIQKLQAGNPEWQRPPKDSG